MARAKLEGTLGKRYPLNMRTTLEMRNRLQAAAAASGRSMTQEVELRLERTFDNPWADLDAVAATHHIREAIRKLVTVQSALIQAFGAGVEIPKTATDAGLELGSALYELIEVQRALSPKPKKDNSVRVPLPGPSEVEK